MDSRNKGYRGIEVPTHHFEQFIPRESRIYVNRNLKMNSLKWVGFDMDHTLALYNGNFIEALAYDLAREALIRERGYPELLRQARYDPDFGIRGLVVDKDEGNLLKMDQFAYVARAYHGRRALDRETRKHLYSGRSLNLSSDRFWTSDTLFGLPEISLYASAVEVFEAEKEPLDTRQLFEDVRYSVDLVHRDGSLKAVIQERMGECFLRDTRLAATLEKFRQEGKRLFLLTNSDYAYTSRVLAHLLDDEMHGRRWWESFDLIVTSSRKPAFFKGRRRWRPVEQDEHPVPSFAGGNFRLLEQEMGAMGDEILYVGDHIFGDILRSKKLGGWRTCMIIEELEHEIRAGALNESLREKMDELRDANSGLLYHLGRTRSRLDEMRRKKLSRYRSMDREGLADLDREIEEAGEEERHLDESLTRNILEIKELEEAALRRFNPYWGSLCKEDNEISRFGAQIQDYACLYTSRASNFLHYPGDKYFRSPTEFMPHEE